MWDRIKAACKHSLTVAWGYVLLAFGAIMEGINAVAAILNDPTIVQEVTQLLGASPRALAVFASLSGLATIGARLRSLVKAG